MYYKRLDPQEYRMLTAIRSGASLGEVFAKAFSDSTMDETSQTTLLQEALQQWTILGWPCTTEDSETQTTAAGNSH